MLKRSTTSTMLTIALLSIVCAQAYSKTRSQSDEIVKELKVPYIAKYADGTSERIIVSYSANFAHQISQLGEGWTVEHPYDDRRCIQETQGHVLRQAFLVTHAGLAAPLEKFQKIYIDANVRDRGPDNKLQALTYHVTCGEVMRDFKMDVERKKISFVNRFDSIIGSDSDQSLKDLQKMLGATEIVLAQ